MKTNRGSKIGSNDRFWFSVVVLGIIFKFSRDVILEPPVKPDILKSSANNRRCCKSFQHQLIGAEPCTWRNLADFPEMDMDKDTDMNTDVHNFY